MSRRAPPPSSQAPVSKEVVAIVKKKISAPRGPPPDGLRFAPKEISAGKYKLRDDENLDDSYEEESFDASYDDNDSPRNGKAGSKRGDDNDDEDEDIVYKPDRKADTRSDFSESTPKPTNSKRAESKSERSTRTDDDSQSQQQSATAPPRIVQSGKLLVFNYAPILKATYRELRAFVLSAPPGPQGVTVRCYIERNRSMANRLAPFYSLCADLEDGTGRELMVCAN